MKIALHFMLCLLYNLVKITYKLLELFEKVRNSAKHSNIRMKVAAIFCIDAASQSLFFRDRVNHFWHSLGEVNSDNCTMVWRDVCHPVELGGLDIKDMMKI